MREGSSAAVEPEALTVTYEQVPVSVNAVSESGTLDRVSPRTLIASRRQQQDGGGARDYAFEDASDDAEPRLPLTSRVAGYVKSLDPRTIEGDRRPFYIFAVLALLSGLDDAVVGLVLPELRAEFGAGAATVLVAGSALTVFSLLLSPLYGWLSDRVTRVYLVRISAIGSNFFSTLSAFATGLPGFFGLRSASGLVAQVNGPATFTLLADYYKRESFGRVVTLLPAAATVSAIGGPILAGFLIAAYGWRPALLGLGILATLVGCLSLLLKEPRRGASDRAEPYGTDETDLDDESEEPPLSFSEAWRATRAVHTVRRIWFATPFLTVAALGMPIFVGLYWAEAFGLGPEERGLLASFSGVVTFIGLLFAAPIAGRLLSDRPGRIMTLAGLLTAAQAGVLVVLALSHSLLLSIAVTVPLTVASALIAPATAGVLIQVLPARIRGVGVTTTAPFALIGVALFYVALSTAPADSGGIRTLAFLLVPYLAIGGIIVSTASVSVERDIRAARAASLAREAARGSNNAGGSKLLVCRDLDVTYDGTQVLFGVDFDVEQGEIVALLGTNGAGKSTLLRAVSGIQPASNGAILLDGEDITHEPPHLNAGRGVVMMPGGQATFPTLSVEENLRAAAWLYRQDEDYVRVRLEEVLGFFPVLRQRLSASAGNLSGGEQQMVGLGQAFLMRPRLLMIDELSLGLAPSVIEQLLDILRTINAQGTTVVIVEQSVNVALTIARRAVFMEKGEIRFDGPTEELLRLPDLVRSVFIGGASGGVSAGRRRRVRPVNRAADATDDAARQVSDVTVSFGGVLALAGVSLEVRPGEIVGVIGPNGAGKTTLFDVISGFTLPKTGVITLADNDISSLLPDARARLGLARSFQNARLFGALTVRENIAVALESRTTKSRLLAAVRAPQVRQAEVRIARRVDGLIEILGLDAYADKFVSELSTGSRRAVDIACMMAVEPNVLLLDEPSSGLAQAETEELGPVLQRLVRETGAGLLVIEHDLPLLLSMCDRLVAMELGQVLISGPPDEVINHPKVLASYLAASEGVIARSGSAIEAVTAALAPELPDQSAPDAPSDRVVPAPRGTGIST